MAAHTGRRAAVKPIMAFLLSSVLILFLSPSARGFNPLPLGQRRRFTHLASTGALADKDPICFASGSSTKPDLLEALQEATKQALAGLPASTSVVDLAIVSVSSLYDGGAHPPSSVVVPAILATLANDNVQLDHLIGSSVAGCISSLPGQEPQLSCRPIELEAIPAVSLTLAVLPGVNVDSFYVSSSDIPDDSGRVAEADWKRAVGLRRVQSPSNDDDNSYTPPIFVLVPSPAMTELDDLLQGLSLYYPSSQAIGGLSSTVSSLSRAKLFYYQRSGSSSATSCFTDGCVGLSLQGDIELVQMTAQGAKPVGGIYQILKGQDSTISVIVLDEAATEALQEEEVEDEDEEEDEEDEVPMDAKQQAAQFYAKARIPKPVLAEANFLMRTLSDDDQAFMRRQLLVGLDQGGSLGRTASELARLANGEGHRFRVHQVASAGMKDGSVTLPLGSVNIQPGTRLRFFVRESNFAKKEVEALWTGYKKRVLSEQFESEDASVQFAAAACLVVPTLDRGSKFFNGKSGYESSAVAHALPGIPCVAGFYANGVIGKMDVTDNASTGVQGSASGYFLLGSKSGRPIYSPAAAAAAEEERRERQAAEEAEAQAVALEDERREQRIKAMGNEERAPRSPDGELILKRREVHSGRAMTVSTVEWSVAEKTAQPTSTLEGFMWEKETQVDRLRERVPLANLVSQCRSSSADPTKPKPRDWVGPFKQAARQGFVIVPECKRMEPTTGSLRRRYDLNKLIRDFIKANVPVTSVNCDSVLFGGALEDITKAREAASTAAVEQMSEDGIVVPPILASDLLLYPYQLYKLRLAGADAVSLVGGALASKDLKYLIKIASSLQLQTLVTVASEVQIRALMDISEGIDGLIITNRELEDFSFDMTGEQALRLLKSDALKEFLASRDDEFPVLVEGRVGIIGRPDENGEMSARQYIKELKEAGAAGAIVGGGLAATQISDAAEALKSLEV